MVNYTLRALEPLGRHLCMFKDNRTFSPASSEKGASMPASTS
jgi:hypothetical protein